MVGPSEAVLRGLLAAAPDALLAIEPQGTIVFVNDQAERLFGWPKDDLLGLPVETLVPDRFSLGHPSLRSGYMANPTARPMGAGLELWARRRDGSEFPAEISLSGFTTDEGPLVAAAIRDITHSRRAEQRFKAVLESAPDAMVGVGADGRIELVNAQAERLFGWSASDLLGQRVEVLVPVKIGILHVGHRANYVDSPTPRPMGAGRQLSGRRKDGSTFPADISLSTVTDDRGQLMVLAAVRDVTDRLEFEAERQRQALEAQREQSHRLESLGQLAGGVAHDFNNLLGVILNYTTLILRQVDDPQTASDLNEIQAAAERAATLTKQLLTFARRDVAHPEPLDLNEVIRGVASMLDRTLGEQVTLQLRLADEPLIVDADRHQLEQIVINLAINARDAMPAGGVIDFVSRSHPTTADDQVAEVTLEVRDNGIGMSREVAARAFEPFFTTKPRGQGTGLGLATVYGIVRQAGGDVVIDSRVGHGTTMRLTLPATSGAPQSGTPDAGPVSRGSERILLVEDESALRSGTMRLLSEQGYDVLVAVDGLEALEVFDRASGVDLVVTDVAMPRMGGVEFARQLAKRSSPPPIIFMSGYDTGDVPLTGVLLAKPIAEQDLLRAVREVLDGGG